MSVFFVVAWAVALLCFLAVPMVASREVRKRWYRALRYCEWTTTTTTLAQRQQQAAGEASDDQALEAEQFHYRLSSTQEDEIRESFLMERLKPFTTTLKATDVQPTTQEGPVTIISEEATKSSDMNDAEMQTKGDPVVQDDVSNNNSNSVNNQNDYESSDDCSSDGGSSLVDEFLADHSSHISVPLPGYSLLAVGNDDNLTISTTTTTTTTTTTATSHVTAAAKQTGSKRQIPNGCAICLCPFEATDKVTWSSNKECKHVFHADCLLNWFKTSGRRHLRRRRRQEERSGGGNQVLSYAVDPLVKIINFPMLCPCCRQVFVVAGKDNNNNNNKKVIRATVPSTTTATTTSEASSSAESVDENSADVEHGMMETEETTSNTILAAPIIAGSDDNV